MDVKWIKLSVDLFDNRKIKQIRKLPDGANILIMWIQLLCLAGTINDHGFIYVTKDIPYTEQTLATEFDLPVTVVQMGLSVFQRFGMIEVVDDILKLSSWEKYQDTDRLQRIKDYQRDYQREYRAKQKLIAPQEEESTLRKLYVNKQIKNKNREDIEKNNTKYIAECKEVLGYLNSKAGTNFREVDSNFKWIRARLDDGYKVEDMRKVIDNKVTDWKNTDYARYLRPQTLFRPGNMESYLNEVRGAKKATTEPQRKGSYFVQSEMPYMSYEEYERQAREKGYKEEEDD